MSASVVMAPLSNNPLREWPIEHYRELARLLVARLDATVSFVGTREQRLIVSAAIRSLPSDRFRNLCGMLTWAQTGALLRAAGCVIANNSGIAHYAAEQGVPTLDISGASHNPYEWMARGRAVSVLVKQTGCSPCAIGQLADCPYDKRCLREITPAAVFEIVARRLSAGTETAAHARRGNGAGGDVVRLQWQT